jgi:putative addiction module killer protein
VFQIRYYVTPSNKDVYREWLKKLRDPKAQAALIRRVNRIEQGNFGDHRYLGSGVSELRIDVGPGYRLYYAIDGTQIVLLLCGGDKSTQSADIEKACAYWKEWQTRGRQKEPAK